MPFPLVAASIVSLISGMGKKGGGTGTEVVGKIVGGITSIFAKGSTGTSVFGRLFSKKKRELHKTVLAQQQAEANKSWWEKLFGL